VSTSSETTCTRTPSRRGASTTRAPLGWWLADEAAPPSDARTLPEALRRIREPVGLVTHDGADGVVAGGTVAFGTGPSPPGALPVVGYAPSCPVEHLGDAGFCGDHGLRYAYLGGSMANGISSTDLVEALGRAGMLGFFGAGGLPPAEVEAAVDRLSGADYPHGFNLIHSPNEPDLEAAVVDVYLRHGVNRIEASAFLRLTLPLVRYRVHGIHRDASGAIVTPNRVIAKASRVELATKFFSPPPERLLQELVSRGDITAGQADLASQVPVAQDLTAEADSGGHTDGRPALALLPTLCAVRDRLQAEHGYAVPLRVGLAGGIATPPAAAAAFAMGAAYVMTGSVNQACVESGSCDTVRAMLAEAGQADVAMAPSADMFEMGVKVQVLKRGTMFAMRAAKLYELYRAYGSIEDLPAAERTKLEQTVFLAPLDAIWQQTRAFFQVRDPRQIDRAEKDPKRRMALVFRWYLGQASHWANRGDPSRKVDYQVWCGPSMGAFNEWVRGSFLEGPEHRRVVTVALNVLHGAAVVTRINHLRVQGVALAPEVQRIVPLEQPRLEEYLR